MEHLKLEPVSIIFHIGKSLFLAMPSPKEMEAQRHKWTYFNHFVAHTSACLGLIKLVGFSLIKNHHHNRISALSSYFWYLLEL